MWGAHSLEGPSAYIPRGKSPEWTRGFTKRERGLKKKALLVFFWKSNHPIIGFQKVVSPLKDNLGSSKLLWGKEKNTYAWKNWGYTDNSKIRALKTSKQWTHCWMKATLLTMWPPFSTPSMGSKNLQNVSELRKWEGKTALVYGGEWAILEDCAVASVIRERELSDWDRSAAEVGTEAR